MKRYFYACFLVAICAFSWFSVIKNYKSGNAAFETYLAAAKSAYDKKIYSEAESNYKKALSKRPSDEKAGFGLASTYYAEEKYKEAADICENLRVKNAGSRKVAILEAKSLYSGGKYSKSLKILEEMEQDEETVKMVKEIKSSYSLRYVPIDNYTVFDVCSPLALHLSVIYEKGRAAAFNSKGVKAVHGDLTRLGAVCEDGSIFPAVSDGVWCFVDWDGKRRVVPDEPLDFLGPLSNGLAAAGDGYSYFYVDASFSRKKGSYDAAYNFQNGRAVVSENGKLKIINAELETISETAFSGVLADPYGYTEHFGKSVFIKDNEYFLCDSGGASIGGFKAEYIGLPMESGAPVEFMSQNLYGFVSPDTGKTVIEPKYEDAGAFCRGLAPVKQDGKWGFIDEKGSEIVPPTFELASPLSKSGTAWIKNEAGFALLTFYYLSEEE